MLQSKAFPQLHARLGTSANTHSIKYTAPSRWDLHNCDTEGIKKNRLLGLGAITEMSARKGSKLGAGSRLQRLLSPGLCVPSIALLCAHGQVPSSKQPKSFPCPPPFPPLSPMLSGGKYTERHLERAGASHQEALISGCVQLDAAQRLWDALLLQARELRRWHEMP